jgi:hypothetical protein
MPRRPTPPPVTNRIATMLYACWLQFEHYAHNHREQGKIEKAATNQKFADSIAAVMEDMPPMLPVGDHEHIHVVHNPDGSMTMQKYGEARRVPDSVQTIFMIPAGVTDYVITRRKIV